MSSLKILDNCSLNELSFRVNIKNTRQTFDFRGRRNAQNYTIHQLEIFLALLLPVLFCGSVNAQLSTSDTVRHHNRLNRRCNSEGARNDHANGYRLRPRVVTNDSGNYRADFLPIGPYRVTVTATGFKKLDREGVVLTVTEEAHLDLSLTIGGGE
jgi:hypothetical protein